MAGESGVWGSKERGGNGRQARSLRVRTAGGPA
jgi:hypothetical protein